MIRTPLPAPGPAWAGTLMGTSIAATLTHAHGVPVLPWFFGVVALGILAVTAVGWLRHREPGFTQNAMGPWGMVSMGVLACGSAWTALSGSDAPQMAGFAVGAPLALVVAANQLRGFEGAPVFPWGLALVAPNVAATTAGQLVAHGHGEAFRWFGIFCFFLALLTAVPVFLRCYVAVFRRETELPLPVAGTAWIPVGVLGQSTAAAQLLFGRGTAAACGCVLLAAALPAAVWAATRFYPAVAAWAGYTPGWWSSTFPVGTVSLGSHMMAGVTGWGWLDVVSRVCLAVLMANWFICAVRFAGGLREPGGARTE